MKRRLELTEDGSHTLYIPELDEHFHSIHGAIQESMHVFIKNGLNKCNKQEITLLEIGFGTGLNALLSYIHRSNRCINYYSLEKHPLHKKEYEKLNYTHNDNEEIRSVFLQMHEGAWEHPIKLTENFSLTKIQCDLKTKDLKSLPMFDLIYFDAFAPSKQPDMWSDDIFQKISHQCNHGAIFTTYCAKGDVRRSLQKNGFQMQRLAGPPGKKQMLFGEKA